MKNNWNFWARATRFRVLPVMVIPVLLGGVSAYAWHGTFHLSWFLFTLFGAVAAHLFSNMVNDLWDYRNGVDGTANETAAAIQTNSGILTNKGLSEKTFALVTWGLFAAAIGTGLIISIFRGWSVLLLGLIGGLIAYFYVAPPLKFGYRGKGYSELAIFLSFGVLPVMGTYFVQIGRFDLDAFILSFPIGLLTTLILFNHHFLHWQADQKAGKRTLVVLWGETKALLFSKVLAFAAFATIVLCVALQVLPWYALISLAAAIPLTQVYRSLDDTNTPKAYSRLMGASLKTTVRCGSLLIICLLFQGIITY